MADPISTLPAAMPPVATPDTPETPTGAIDDCWRRIGVTGDRTCPRLSTYIHCRNCPAHALAAVALLDTLAVDQLAAGSGEYGTEADTASSAERLAGESCIIFRVGDEWLAFPTAALGEVTAPAPVHSLPHRRHAALMGVAAVRGALLTCISLALLFGNTDDANQPDNQRAARFLILGQGRNALALPVSEVAGVERVPTVALLPLPATLARASARYTRALFEFNGHSVGLLDADLLRQALSRSLS